MNFTHFLTRRLPLTFALALLWFMASPATGNAQTIGTHPVVGTWNWTGFNGQCKETLQYRADGVLLSTSGDAVTTWRYSPDAALSPQGFFRLLETLTQHNSQKDCYGDVVDQEGMEAIRFIQLNPAKDRLIVCKTASLAECYGPLKRQPSP